MNQKIRKEELRLYLVVDQNGIPAEDAEDQPLTFSSKFEARAFRDELNAISAQDGSGETYHIAPGPDHKKKGQDTRGQYYV